MGYRRPAKARIHSLPLGFNRGNSASPWVLGSPFSLEQRINPFVTKLAFIPRFVNPSNGFRAEDVSRAAAELEPFSFWPHRTVAHVMDEPGPYLVAQGAVPPRTRAIRRGIGTL